MSNFIFIQTLGIISLVLFVISIQQREKENLLLLQTAGTLLFIVQYILAGKYTGAALFTVVLMRSSLFYYYKKTDKKPSIIVLIVFQSALGIFAYLTWQNIFSLLPIIATTSKTWGTWQDDMSRTRKISLLSQSLMVVYNLTAAMYTGALTEVCNLISTLVAMRRYDIRNKENN